MKFNIEYEGCSFRIRCPEANEGKGATGNWAAWDQIATLVANGQLFIAGSPHGLIEEHVVFSVIPHETKLVGDIPLDLEDENSDEIE